MVSRLHGVSRVPRLQFAWRVPRLRRGEGGEEYPDCLGRGVEEYIVSFLAQSTTNEEYSDCTGVKEYTLGLKSTQSALGL